MLKITRNKIIGNEIIIRKTIRAFLIAVAQLAGNMFKIKFDNSPNKFDPSLVATISEFI